jgi:hypothetical protein
MPDWLIIVLIIAAGIGIALLILAKVRHKRAYQAFATAAKLNLDHFSNKRDFSFSGSYRGYPVSLKNWTPPQAPDKQDTVKTNWIRIDIPLSNPNNKYLSIERLVDVFTWRDMLSQPDILEVQHEFGEEVKIEASDLWFSSFVLNEVMTKRIEVLLKQTRILFVAIEGDALFAVLPNTLSDTSNWKPVAESMTLLTDIKDALNS